MSEYKRLTIRDEFGNTDIFGVDSELLYNELSFTEANALTKAFNHLSELEDKIENNTLIELLCKAGDKVYQFDNGGEIYEIEIRSIYYANNTLIYDCGYFAFDERAIGESIFLTKAEAEKKLEELKNENTCK